MIAMINIHITAFERLFMLKQLIAVSIDLVRPVTKWSSVWLDFATIGYAYRELA